MTSSGSIRNFSRMWIGEVAMKVWMRERFAGFSASAARSTSSALARASEHTTLSLMTAATACTAAKSPGLATAKPASITSTLSRSSASAMRTFSSSVMEAPGDCSPSRKVVSKIIRWSFIARCLYVSFRAYGEESGQIPCDAQDDAENMEVLSFTDVAPCGRKRLVCLTAGARAAAVRRKTPGSTHESG